MESRKVAALKLVQKSHHAPPLYHSQLIINVFQIFAPATPGEASVQNNVREHSQGTQSRRYDWPSDRRREEVCLRVLPQRPCSSPKSRGLCSQNSKGKSLSLDTGSKEQLEEVTAGNTADHLVAQTLSSWSVRFWVG